MQIFQRPSDAVRYIHRTKGCQVINYVDDFIGVGLPSIAKRYFDSLYKLLQDLAISVKKLVEPSAQVVCLGVLIDSAAGTISVPEGKLQQIKSMVNTWKNRTSCNRRQLQSLLGHLIYVHKCVKPSRYFVNRMLEAIMMPM